ncbi:GATOR complex protein WDR59-like isoform X3 [Mya arenaria]|uniref:GATOR complex protein WDR59-like isoform X3 n=1 Tax=Mya arenaria TaxID=6604 RepID=UPI0022E12A52|nr:GATOR complex protein WDR59-like isoform X3 [Mya arenaria]
MSQWGGNISVDFGDLQANTMGVDCLGKWAILPGRRVLAMVNLDDPTENVHRLTRTSKYDISCVQWNPHASHAHLFSTACMQKLELWAWDDSFAKQVCSMKAHSRNISNIDWSPFDVNVIASCSVDTFTMLWDVRDPKRPTASCQSVCGASQVKWNKVTNNLFATAHEGDVRIWDPRKLNQPVVYLTAHLSKIHCIDWNHLNEQRFSTASHDCSAKFWEYTDHRQDKGMLKSGSPVWRARFTPFGDGLITVVMSTLRRGENSLYMWNNMNLKAPVHQFVGHTDVVMEFAWRKKDEGERDYELVTWSRDQNLKIWQVDPVLQRLCGHDAVDCSENETTLIELNETPKDNSQEATVASISINSIQSDQRTMTLSQEFSLVNKYIPNVTIEKLDSEERQCSVSISGGKHKADVTISFPMNYPNIAPPCFEIASPTGLSTSLIKKLHRVLTDTSQKSVKKNLNCLEPCIRQVATAFENMTLEERKTPDTDVFPPIPTSYHPQHTGYIQPLPFSAYQDFQIPFPRTCGAQFNSAGLLVLFARSKEANKISEKTPKALSELATMSSTNRVRNSQSSSGFAMYSRSPPTPKQERMSVGQWYTIQSKRQRTKSRTFKDLQEAKDKVPKDKKKKSVKLEPVRVYDTLCLLRVNRELGEKYRLDTGNIPAMCEHNKLEAAAVGRKDLVRLWSLIPVMCSPNLAPSPNPDDGTPWAQRPFGRNMLQSLMEHYRKTFDVQTLAMLICVFWDRRHFNLQAITSSGQSLKKSASKVSLDYVPANYNPYHTVSSMSGLLRSLTKNIHEPAVKEELSEETAMVKLRRSNSFNDVSFEDYRFADEIEPKEKREEQERKLHENNCRLLDPSMYVQYDHILKMYADILARWGLRNQAVHIKKHVTIPPEPHAGIVDSTGCIEFGVNCFYCKADVRGVKCGSCKNQAFRCIICHTGVRGASNFCLNCGHGGHASHMREWFKTEIMCPTGCGCQCAKGNPF